MASLTHAFFHENNRRRSLDPALRSPPRSISIADGFVTHPSPPPFLPSPSLFHSPRFFFFLASGRNCRGRADVIYRPAKARSNEGVGGVARGGNRKGTRCNDLLSRDELHFGVARRSVASFSFRARASRRSSRRRARARRLSQKFFIDWHDVI